MLRTTGFVVAKVVVGLIGGLVFTKVCDKVEETVHKIKDTKKVGA